MITPKGWFSSMVKINGGYLRIRNRTHKVWILVFMASLFLNCSRNEVNEQNGLITYYEMKEKEWEIIADKKIYFGHQSVGNNIVDGIVKTQKDYSGPSLKIMMTREPSFSEDAFFAHAWIDKVGDPKSKIDDFADLLRSGFGNVTDIAFMKFCYEDFNKNTDIAGTLSYYNTVFNELKKEYPNVIFLHFTVPLTVPPRTLKDLIKRIIKMDDNVYRNKYNELLRKNYSTDELFDIAAIESTYPDGSLNTYGNGIPGLIPELSDDGGHLNEEGKALVAHQLVKKIVSIGR